MRYFWKNNKICSGGLVNIMDLNKLIEEIVLHPDLIVETIDFGNCILLNYIRCIEKEKMGFIIVTADKETKTFDRLFVATLEKGENSILNIFEDMAISGFAHLYTGKKEMLIWFEDKSVNRQILLIYKRLQDRIDISCAIGDEELLKRIVSTFNVEEIKTKKEIVNTIRDFTKDLPYGEINIRALLKYPPLKPLKFPSI